jgi:hypothetical protein
MNSCEFLTVLISDLFVCKSSFFTSGTKQNNNFDLFEEENKKK